MSAPYSHVITGHQPGPRLLILAGVHGDEYEPIAAVRRLIDRLSSATFRGRVTLVPVVNAPAYHRLQRTGPDGLDLARTFPGRLDGSVTEVIAAHTAAWIRDCDALIDLHTGGLALRLAPLAGYMLHEDESVLAQQRRMAHAFNLPVIWGTTSRLEGRSLCVARDARIPAIYTEWGGGGGCHPDGVRDYVDGCCNVMRELGMFDGEPPPSRVQYIVEDNRSQSGVLTTHHPAERDGFFEAACRLGDIVQVGDVLGWLHDLAGGPSLPVKSQFTGLVLLLRALPVTKSGDGLAVILETSGPGEVRHG